MNVEWLITENCNFSCEYCGLYNNQKKPETDRKKLTKFLIKVKAHQLDIGFDFFIFGGEPFLHPEIDFVIQELNRLDIEYTFQTNLSNRSTEKIMEIIPEQDINKINISVHSNEQSISDYIKNIKLLLSKRGSRESLQNVEVMYCDIGSISVYSEIKDTFPEADFNLILCPVSDFLVQGFKEALTKFNQMRKDKEFKWVNFEDVKKHDTFGKLRQRSIVWQEFIEGKQTPKGKICLLKDNFLMFDSHLEKYNCCFHDIVDQESCPYDSCFLS